MAAGPISELEFAAPSATVRTLPLGPAVARRPAPSLERVRALAPALDLLAAFLAASAAAAPGWTPLVFAALVLAVLVRRGAYAPRASLSALDAVPATLAAVLAGGFGAVLARVYLEGAAAPPAPELGLLLGAGALLVGASRSALVLVQRRLARSAVAAEPAIIVGAGRVADRLVRHLAEDPRCPWRFAGHLDPGAADAEQALAEVAARTRARHVVLAFTGRPDGELPGLVRAAEARGLQVWVVPRLFDVANHRSTHDAVGGLPLVGLRPASRRDWRLAGKHTADRIAAALLVLGLLPVLAVIAAAVRLSGPGPVLFRQTRVGLDGRHFELLKFRSMHAGAGAVALLPAADRAPGGVEGADRRTRVGRWLRRTSLDELPQLLNVLRGEMSLVGPRPERPEFAAAFGEDVERYAERHRTRCGITGWAQVHGLRGQTSISDRAAYDNYYIEHWSPGLDLKILALTVLAVLRGTE